MEQKIREAREHYFSSVYGRFDLINEVIPHDILMKKPRIAMRYICRVLEIASSQIPYETLKSWLRRYRILHKKPASKTEALKNSNPSGDIFDFIPTDPFAKPLYEKPLIKIL